MDLVKLVSPEVEPRIAKLLEAWESLTKGERLAAKLEHLCAAAEIGFPHVLGLVVEAAYNYGHDVARLLASVAQPKVMERLVREATSGKKGAHEDRRMFLLSQGLLPTPKGSQIFLGVSAQASANAAAASGADLGIPDFAKDAQEAVEAVRVNEEGKE